MRLTPLIFAPRFSLKNWGGRRLERYGKSLPPGQQVGESWEIYDRPDASAVVEGGPFHGQTLHALMAEWGPRLLGPREFEKGHPYFPLMVKFLDAREALSVQVHPDDDQALRLVGPHEMGKNELWMVLEAEPGSSVVAGLKPGTDKAAFLAALRAGHLETVLQSAPVKPGDFIFNPSGRVHAVGAGCLIAEIQQNSDATFRVYDYGRLEHGKPRDLHLDQALECIRFDAELAGRPVVQPLAGLDLGYFKVESVEPQDRPRWLSVPTPCFQILVAVAGEMRIQTEAGGVDLKAGSSCLIPATLTPVVESGEPGSRVLRVLPF